MMAVALHDLSRQDPHNRLSNADYQQLSSLLRRLRLPSSLPNLPTRPVITATALLTLTVTTFFPADTTKSPSATPSVMPF
jgi:hypothetical protein